MFPDYVCNFLATLAHPPWRKALNWDVHMTMYGERRISFHSYVQVSTAAGQVTTFSQFSILPTELQLRILTFCSARTLFQVMHVSSTLRIEASKLFWANPNAFFLIETGWLLNKGHPGYTSSDSCFLAHVQNVEIEFYIGMDTEICPRYDGVMEIKQGLIEDFWKRLKKRVPNVKKVIFNQNWESPLWMGETEPVSQALRILIQSCLPKIEASAFILEEEDPLTSSGTHNTIPSAKKWQRSLYRPSEGGAWERVQSGTHHKTILIPMKRFNGPVGEVEGSKYNASRVLLQNYGLWALLVEALDRHHFDNGKNEPFSCPSSACDGYFEKAGEWTVHAAESHHNEWMGENRFDILPNEIRIVFEERERALERKNEKITSDMRRIYNEWNQGIGKRREIERRWIEQLENDEAWYVGKKARESRLWRDFSLRMDPTWCGQ